MADRGFAPVMMTAGDDQETAMFHRGVDQGDPDGREVGLQRLVRQAGKIPMPCCRGTPAGNLQAQAPVGSETVSGPRMPSTTSGMAGWRKRSNAAGCANTLASGAMSSTTDRMMSGCPYTSGHTGGNASMPFTEGGSLEGVRNPPSLGKLPDHLVEAGLTGTPERFQVVSAEHPFDDETDVPPNSLAVATVKLPCHG